MEIEVLLQVLIVTGASFSKTRLPFCEAPKPLPLIATVPPIDPVVADTLAITGAGSAVELIDTLSKVAVASAAGSPPARSEEHTSELQSQSNLVCRLLLEKK